MPPKRGPDPRVWFIRGSIGVAALAGLWLGLQTLFPVTESQVNQAPTPITPIDASAVGAPEPPNVQPAAQQPAPTAVTQVAPAPEGDRLPGLPTPVPGAVAQSAPPASAAAAAQPPAQAQPPAAAPPAAQPAAEPKPREETPSQQPIGKPTLEPIPPPEAPASDPPALSPEQQAAQDAQRAAAAAAPAPAPKPQAPAPAAKPQSPPPAAASTGGPFELAASASPVNPVSENAVITVSVRATQNGAPLAGAACMATIYYRTNTAKQPDGGFRTNASGVGSFSLDARGTTYGHYIPIDVTCSGRGGTTTARTGFTPVKGR